MFAFPYVDSLSHYESTNRVEERRASVFLLDVLHCGLSIEQQMLVLLQQMIACSIRGYAVVGPVHLDVRFFNGAGIGVRKEHTLMAQHAMQSLDLGCVAWRSLTNGVIFLRVLFRHWVHINPTLQSELRLSQWENAQTGQHAFWTFLRNSMLEQFGRLGLARELMCPLSFGAPGPKFSFVHLNEAQRYAALHDRHRQPVVVNMPARPLSPQPSTSGIARAPLAPTFRPIAPMPPTVPTTANISAPVARCAVPVRASHPVLASLLERPPVAPADLAPPPPPPQQASYPNNTFTYNDCVVDVQAFVRAAEEVGRQMVAQADSSAARTLTPPPPPPAPQAQVGGNEQEQPAQNRRYTRAEGATVARELEELLASLEREGFGPAATSARDRVPAAQQVTTAARAGTPPPTQKEAATADPNRHIKAEPAEDGCPPVPPPQRQVTPPPAPLNAKQEPPELAAVVPGPSSTRQRTPDSGYSRAVRWLKRSLYSLEEEAPEEEDESPPPKSRKP